MSAVSEKTGNGVDAVTSADDENLDVEITVDELASQPGGRRPSLPGGLDPNFPAGALERLKSFLDNGDIFAKPDSHARDISDARVVVSLLTTNSPYAEVRAVVDPHDDPSLPVSTIRAWVIGLTFVVFIAFINQLFSVRQPSIALRAEVVQLLAYPVGKAAERFLPDVGFTLFGVRHSLNPGPFNKKEPMLISIMPNVGKTLPSSRYIIFTQWLDQYFGQKYAQSFGYQILLALSTNLMCLASLVSADGSCSPNSNHPVPGPFKTIYSISRYRFFLVAFGCMFVLFWFPDYIFGALSLFNWVAWIAPDNFKLAAITGVRKGLGFNPLPTFDWNVATHVVNPLIVPFRVTFSTFIGVLVGGITIIGLYWTNTYNTAYLPINSNFMYNHFGGSYNVSRILDHRGWLDEDMYQAYSPVYLSASLITMYYYFFAVYAATISYAILYHRHDIALGFRSLLRSFKKDASQDFKDVHSRMMSRYPEVPEWWYLILNLLAIAFGVAAIAGWPTEPRNALAMNFFKCFGYVTTAHALDFANDLKLAHYLKIPQRHTFVAQVVAVFVSAFVCTGDRFMCLGVNTYFTAAVLFGSLGARKVFGSGGIYMALLSAFPVGLALPILFYMFQRKFPRTHWVAKVHPVMVLSGGISWSPLSSLMADIRRYNIAYMWPAVIPGWLSMVYLRRRYLAFWSKYNYVLSAAFSTAIAIAAVVIFFAVSFHGFEIKCMPEGEYFGPRIGTYAA
ncbi:opt oligopeptide transporter [Colletotrichum plurivorum]|uniref:Opt oligopeptide transporter n=1 Tax=Colletotrichum plurivorum TaxID=2175906 RepID=A0A8H6K8Y9_9PEZI|nr:opt oligopeptide transporter [Colletotrichum plurivorum]